MPWTSDHTRWFVEVKETLKTADGDTIRLFRFQPEHVDTHTFSAWAKHFRNHYCLDTEIDLLREGTGCTRAEYLQQFKFPDNVSPGFGPGVRAGDFAEILVSDFLAYLLDHWVPRTRYQNKMVKNESTKGSDIVGFKLFDGNETVKDVLTTFEVKAQFSGNKAKTRLQEAIDDSIKDERRVGESLNAIKQRLFEKRELDKVKIIQRFQNPEDRPYTEQVGAAAFFSTNVFDKTVITTATTKGHPNRSKLLLIVISSDDCMNLTNRLYQLAADEA